MNSTCKFLGATALSVLTTGAASAAIFATNPSGVWSDGGSFLAAATAFSVGSKSVVVPALGLFDEGGDGMDFIEKVGIFTLTDSPTLLGSVTIKEGTGSVFHDGSRWENLTKPIELKANTSYLLAWTVRPVGDPVTLIDSLSNVSIDPLFKVLGSGYIYTDTGIEGLRFPSQSQRSVGLYAFGGNFQAQAVPEPAMTACVVGAGLLGFAAWRSRRPAVKG